MPHGDHWHAVHDDAEAIAATIQEAITESRLADLQPAEEAASLRCRYLVGPSQPLAALTLIEERTDANEVVSIIPLVQDLAENELEILSAGPVMDEDFAEVEGVVTAITRDGAEVPFFCPQWLAVQPLIEHGGRFQIGLGALAYSLEQAPTEFAVTEGSFFETEKRRRMDEEPDFDPSTFTSVTIQTGNLRTMIAREDGDFEFQSVVEEVASFRGLGTSGYSMLLNLAPSERQPIMVKVLAAAKVLQGYEPKFGDSVRGVAWLQGMLGTKIDAEDSWLDSAEAAHANGRDSFFQMAGFLFGNPHLPCACCAVGSALAGAGWEIVEIEEKLFRAWAPAFVTRHREKEFWIFVRSAIKGICETEPFPVNQERVLEYTQQHNVRCLWVTVTLEPLGQSYSVSVDGLEEFTEELRLPLQIRRPEHSEVLDLGRTEPAPEPMLDETVAATVFAEGIAKQDLRELSKLLVEDLEYISDTANVSIRGRHQYLSYLGTKLHEWVEKGRVITASADTVAYSGVVRACALSYIDGVMMNAAVFTGRRGHIARIHVVEAK